MTAAGVEFGAIATPVGVWADFTAPEDIREIFRSLASKRHNPEIESKLSKVRAALITLSREPEVINAERRLAEVRRRQTWSPASWTMPALHRKTAVAPIRLGGGVQKFLANLQNLTRKASALG